ncbi:hypothetical protein AB0945_43095 [Streptomyces sp. NPDC005474]|uniref:hypothetical protein n=1 Tax=Streptomyces sp. NPDC005474 TaxID=3154878 RepID=UPI00345211D7
MAYEFLSDVLGRGGAEALEKALAEFAGRAGSDAELEAAVDLVCRVIADDTARLTAVGDQRKAEAELQKAKMRGLEREVAEVRWQADMAVGFALGEILQPGPPPL